MKNNKQVFLLQAESNPLQLNKWRENNAILLARKLMQSYFFFL